MKMKIKSPWAVFLVLGILSTAATAPADRDNDAEAIKQAVLNYTNAIYQMKPKLIEKSVHPRLQKVGYVPKKEGSGYREIWMTFDELREMANHWNKDGHLDPATARREVKILEQLDQTAVVRLEAEWGIDFIHLAKQGDKWMIINVIWQTYPAD